MPLFVSCMRVKKVHKTFLQEWYFLKMLHMTSFPLFDVKSARSALTSPGGLGLKEKFPRPVCISVGGICLFNLATPETPQNILLGRLCQQSGHTGGSLNGRLAKESFSRQRICDEIS
jgi:hypothetical protein